MTAAEANRFNRLDQEPYFHAGTQALLGPERDVFIKRYKFDLRPATDDRPYFGDFFRWRALPEILALRARAGPVFWSGAIWCWPRPWRRPRCWAPC